MAKIPLFDVRPRFEPIEVPTHVPRPYHGGMDTPVGPHVLRAGEGDVTGEPGLLDRYLLESTASAGRVALVEHVLGAKALAPRCTGTAVKTNIRSC
jgi:hypothetical protein